MAHHSGACFSFSSLTHPYLYPVLTPVPRGKEVVGFGEGHDDEHLSAYLQLQVWPWLCCKAEDLDWLAWSLFTLRGRSGPTLEIQDKTRNRVMSPRSLGEYSPGSSSLIWGIMTEGRAVTGEPAVFWEILLQHSAGSVQLLMWSCTTGQGFMHCVLLHKCAIHSSWDPGGHHFCHYFFLF